MIGNFARNALGGRVGGKKNTSIYTISPKGGTINVMKSLGSINKATVLGNVGQNKTIGSVGKS